VLEHRYLDLATFLRDRGDPAIDADTVIEVHDIVADLERAGESRWRRLSIPARTTQPACAAEDLVIGEHPEGRHHEAAVQCPHRQRCACGTVTTILQQFIE